jgi:hypothetical protein
VRATGSGRPELPDRTVLVEPRLQCCAGARWRRANNPRGPPPPPAPGLGSEISGREGVPERAGLTPSVADIFEEISRLRGDYDAGPVPG